jgi:hypothetical protein
MQNWLRALTSGGGLEAVRKGLLASQEYFNRQGGTAAAYIQALYRDTLGRPASAAEVARWAPAVAKDRADVVRRIVTSDEAHKKVIGAAYQAILHRAVDASGLANWLAALRKGATEQQLEAGLLNSLEYRNRK